MITSTQWMILRLMQTLGREITFTEMAFYIGEDKFVRLWHDTDVLVDRGIISRRENEQAFLRFVYAPTEKGLALYRTHEPDYRGLPFAHPVQKEI